MNVDEVRADAEEVLGDGYYLPGEPEGGNPYIASHVALAKATLELVTERATLRAALEQIGDGTYVNASHDYVTVHAFARAALGDQR